METLNPEPVAPARRISTTRPNASSDTENVHRRRAPGVYSPTVARTKQISEHWNANIRRLLGKPADQGTHAWHHNAAACMERRNIISIRFNLRESHPSPRSEGINRIEEQIGVVGAIDRTTDTHPAAFLIVGTSSIAKTHRCRGLSPYIARPDTLPAPRGIFVRALFTGASCAIDSHEDRQCRNSCGRSGTTTSPCVDPE